MNREILFRGRPIDKNFGEWVEGFYMEDLLQNVILLLLVMDIRAAQILQCLCRINKLHLGLKVIARL